MSLLNGLSGIKQLPVDIQQEFESFYNRNMDDKLRPVFIDVALFIAVMGCLFHISSQLNHEMNWSGVHPFSYIHLACATSLSIIHRISKVRQRTPLMAYWFYLMTLSFAYNDFVNAGGGINPIFGALFTIAFMGVVTASVKHTLIIYSINLLLLFSSNMIIFGASEWFTKSLEVLNNWYVFMCLLVSPTLAFFVQWVFRNVFAMQFLLNDKNVTLRNTLKTLKKTEQQLIQQQKHQALNHMAKGLLHEIINPINSASQAIGFAKSMSDDEDIEDALDEALSQQQRISNIVTDLRNFAQPETNQDIESVDLNDLTAKAIKFCHREIQTSETKISVHISDDLFIECHPSALTQVFVNVILNACDALKQKNSSSREIVISSYEQAENISISIKDNGMGISSENLKYITNPFFTDEASPEKMGLGLSICQTIMRHHNGTMEIDSQLNEWTEVTLTMPAHIKVASPSFKGSAVQGVRVT